METPTVSLKDLFQQEFPRIVAVITRQFGVQHMHAAEDIASETFLAAAETWGIKGIPANPAAWLYLVARQKAIHFWRRDKIYRDKVMPVITSNSVSEEELDFSEEHIQDSKLRMIFAVCNPVIASEAQIGLALRILCGFGIEEIATAFFTNRETISKRLLRAKDRLRQENIQLEMPADQDIIPRLENVLHVIYLVFNEGYYSRTQDQVLRRDLCLEALRLCLQLTTYPPTNTPATNALIALICFHASRFAARQPEEDTLLLYDEQDSSQWDLPLVRQGMHYLALSASGNYLTSYHLEARIAYWHCIPEDSTTKWEEILQLYDQLLTIKYSAAGALNRLYAKYKVAGAAAALKELLELQVPQHTDYYLLLGALYEQLDTEKAAKAYQQALSITTIPSEIQLLEEKLKNLKK
ncbi:RNA polymerase sigma-70 factor (ECF subfamily) [Chitinophaga dinghuensis]|uniref:RNA polymerase sigma-70 factor (ECF subfamily) n=1 Tax=Chitinophaga dinghuensis TaxID=1539050 RepID=A0A327VK01_9BACT|nr:sigma-70 family RNA polymerase sigma factor [Chitinophaga dinghuensis]RAJ73505.1 RNA polymerase sigma-70 factor (ECF subfamily) [Chitinophaga dinghuensis]